MISISKKYIEQYLHQELQEVIYCKSQGVYHFWVLCHQVLGDGIENIQHIKLRFGSQRLEELFFFQSKEIFWSNSGDFQCFCIIFEFQHVLRIVTIERFLHLWFALFQRAIFQEIFLKDTFLVNIGCFLDSVMSSQIYFPEDNAIAKISSDSTVW